MRKFSQNFMLVVLAAALLLSGGAASALPAYPEKVLSLGAYGDEVSLLQAELKSIGLYLGDVNGLFDENTHASVMALQGILGAEPDGKFGPVTYRMYVAALEEHVLSPIDTDAAQEPSAEVLKGKIIGIDPGHQAVGDIALERVSPRGDVLKPRMSSGATGVKTNAEESVINLLIATKLQQMLSDAGATVVMARTAQEVSLSNAERAALMNQVGVNLWIRLHCDASADANISGASALIPSVMETPEIYGPSLALGKAVLTSFCTATGAKNLGIVSLSNQTGFNWSQFPVIALEMGQLSNACDDVRLNRDAYQTVCAKGMFDGIVAYFAEAEANKEQ